jgi:predicted O-methyltransferase YrrM
MSEAEVNRLVELATGMVVLEIGSYLGHSTVSMAKVAAVVHAVDWHRGDPHAGTEETVHPFLDNLAAHGVRDQVVTHVGRTEDVLPFLRPRIFDLVFHDAYHTTEAVTDDIALFWPLVKSGGVVAFHDYGLFGVKEAVDRLGLLIEHTETLAAVRKP